MVYGLWIMDYGLWFMVCGSWCMDYGLWFAINRCLEIGVSIAGAGWTGNNLKGLNDFHLKAKARIWPRLSYMCHIRSTAERPSSGDMRHTPGLPAGALKEGE